MWAESSTSSIETIKTVKASAGSLANTTSKLVAVTIVSVITELRTWEEPNPQISTVVAAVGSGLSKEATLVNFLNLLRPIEPIVFTQCVCKICIFIFVCCVVSIVIVKAIHSRWEVPQRRECP